MQRSEFPISPKKPAATVYRKIAVNGKQNASGIASRDHTALGIGVDVQNVVKISILCLGGIKSEILHKSESEAVGGIGLIFNSYLTAARHHHTKVFFKLLRREIDDGI